MQEFPASISSAAYRIRQLRCFFWKRRDFRNQSVFVYCWSIFTMIDHGAAAIDAIRQRAVNSRLSWLYTKPLCVLCEQRLRFDPRPWARYKLLYCIVLL